MKTTLHIITALVLAFMLSGCETWQGLGRDVRGITRWGCGDCTPNHKATQVNQPESKPERAPQPPQ